MTHKEIIVTYSLIRQKTLHVKNKQTNNNTKKTNIQAPTLCYAQSRGKGEQHKSLKKVPPLRSPKPETNKAHSQIEVMLINTLFIPKLKA